MGAALTRHRLRKRQKAVRKLDKRVLKACRKKRKKQKHLGNLAALDKALAEIVRRGLWDEAHLAEWEPVHPHAQLLGYGKVRPSNAQPPIPITCVYEAAEAGNTEVLKRLVDAGAPLDTPVTVYNYTPLRVAVEAGQVGCVDLLMSGGANFKAVTQTGTTVLWEAAARGHVAVFDRLVEGGLSVHAFDRNGWTPTHIAAFNGHKVIVNHALNAGARIDFKTLREGWTPLHCAAAGGRSDVVKLLLKRGADFLLKDARPELSTEERMPIEVAVAWNRPKVYKLLEGPLRDHQRRVAEERAKREEEARIRKEEEDRAAFLLFERERKARQAKEEMDAAALRGELV